MNCRFDHVSTDENGRGLLRCVSCGRELSFRNPTPERVARLKAACGIPPEAIPAGVGSQLKALLSYWGIRDDGSCGCDEHAAEMDCRGVEWCKSNREIIIDWMREAAKKQGQIFVKLVAMAALELAIYRARESF